MQSFMASIRLVVATMLICVAGYAAVIWAIGSILTPSTAQGSLIAGADEKIVGSRLIAQKFTKPEYFWPRPSAVDYNASAAGGSNKSPTSPDLTKRAEEIATAMVDALTLRTAVYDVESIHRPRDGQPGRIRCCRSEPDVEATPPQTRAPFSSCLGPWRQLDWE